MGEICLGMTLAEVEQIPGTSAQDWELNKWERNCLSSFANSATVGFTGKDGTELILRAQCVAVRPGHPNRVRRDGGSTFSAGTWD